MEHYKHSCLAGLPRCTGMVGESTAEGGGLFLEEAFAGRQAGWVGVRGLVAAAGIV